MFSHAIRLEHLADCAHNQSPLRGRIYSARPITCKLPNHSSMPALGLLLEARAFVVHFTERQVFATVLQEPNVERSTNILIDYRAIFIDLPQIARPFVEAHAGSIQPMLEAALSPISSATWFPAQSSSQTQVNQQDHRRRDGPPSHPPSPR